MTARNAIALTNRYKESPVILRFTGTRGCVFSEKGDLLILSESPFHRLETEGLDGLEGDHQLFVGGHDDRFPGAVVGGDDARLAEAFVVLCVVALDAEACDAVEDRLAFGQGVFADAAGEDDGVRAAEEHVVGADVLDDAADEHLEGEGGVLIAGVGGVHDVAHVAAADAADGEQAGLLVQDGVDVLGGVADLDHAEHGGGVHVAAAGSHHEALERGEAHGGVDDLAVLDGGHAAAVAEVAGDDRDVFGLPAEEFGGGGVTKRWLVPWKPYLRMPYFL